MPGSLVHMLALREVSRRLRAATRCGKGHIVRSDELHETLGRRTELVRLRVKNTTRV